jgi:hypothetical protein
LHSREAIGERLCESEREVLCTLVETETSIYFLKKVWETICVRVREVVYFGRDFHRNINFSELRSR